MKHSLKKLTAIIVASISAQAEYQNSIKDQIIVDFSNIPNNPKNHTSILNLQVSDFLAAHRSHSSHSSHRSHRSSSSGSYNYSTPSYSMPKYNSDPLGQKPKINKSIPKSTTSANDNSNYRKKIIRQVQTVLLLEGLYNDVVDGIMGPKTREAINKFKKKYNIQSSSLLGPDVLNKLGIKGF